MSEREPQIADQQSRDEALDISKSVIVQAPAGSGKTELLTQRILKLLVLVDDPEEVLAITFTRKAAGEMRDRLLGALRRAANEEEPDSRHEALSWRLAKDVLAKDRSRSWHIIEHPARLRIMTIDALNAALTRQMPLLAKVGASLDIASTPALLYREAATATIELFASGHPDQEAFRVLMVHLDNRPEKVIDLLASSLSKREQWLRHVFATRGDSESRGRLDQAITIMVESELESLQALVPAELARELLAFGQQSATILADSDAPNPLEALLECSGLSAGASSLGAWQALAHLTLTASSQWRKTWDKRLGFPPGNPKRKAEFAELVARLAAISDSREGLAIVRGLPDTRLNESQWAALQALLTVLPVAAAQLELVFRRRARVDYTAVSRAALDALGEAQAPSDLALSLDYRIQHILVDEFQDTSASQFELINQLIAGWAPGDGRTLFCVGDPMQSIYRFREAEVSLFLRAWQSGLGDLPLAPVSLSVNFRSQAGIVDWVNQSFPAIMPPRADLQTAAVPFTRSDAYHPEQSGEAVKLHPLIDHGPVEEAELIVQLVADHRRDNPDATIAILVSGRNHLREIMPALRNAGLLPQAVEIERLDRQSVVHDLVALTRALLHRGDRAAWLAILRAPWCGLSLCDLHALAGGNVSRCLIDDLQDQETLKGLSSAGTSRVRRFLDAILPVLQSSERGQMRIWIESAWRRLGGPACLQDASALGNAAAFFDLLQSLAESNSIDDPLVLDSRLSELFSSVHPDADKKLLIMTMHKAKGLQFDVVIVPGLDRRSSDEDKQLLRWMEFPRQDGRIDLVLSPIAAADEAQDKLEAYLKNLERRRRDLERARLFYVAVTRARSQVHLVARAQTGGEDRELRRPVKRSMLDTIWPVARHRFEAVASNSDRSAVVSDDSSTPEVRAVIRRLPENWRLPDAPAVAQAAKVLQARTVINEDAVSFDWAGQTARYVGTVVHEALRVIADSGVAPGARVLGAFADRVRARLEELGTRGSDLEDAVETAIAAIDQTCTDERGRWILFGEHLSARNEFALSSAEQGVVHNLVLDRTFVDAEGVRWIVDYKVGVHEGADKQAFLDEELGRYRPQLGRYARVMARFEDRPLRTALYFPLYAGWREWDPFRET